MTQPLQSQYRSIMGISLKIYIMADLFLLKRFPQTLFAIISISPSITLWTFLFLSLSSIINVAFASTSKTYGVFLMTAWITDLILCKSNLFGNSFDWLLETNWEIYIYICSSSWFAKLSIFFEVWVISSEILIVLPLIFSCISFLTFISGIILLICIFFALFIWFKSILSIIIFSFLSIWQYLVCCWYFSKFYSCPLLFTYIWMIYFSHFIKFFLYFTFICISCHTKYFIMVYWATW